VKENTQPFILNVRGQGVAINLDFKPTALNIGPVLPYADFAYTILEVRNPSDYDTELISLDYDSQYHVDEEMIAAYTPLEGTDFVLMKVRAPGEPIWEDVQKSFKRKKQREELQGRIAAEPNEELKANIK
jgi:hydrocephalus-inducing protein